MAKSQFILMFWAILAEVIQVGIQAPSLDMTEFVVDCDDASASTSTSTRRLLSWGAGRLLGERSDAAADLVDLVNSTVEAVVDATTEAVAAVVDATAEAAADEDGKGTGTVEQVCYDLSSYDEKFSKWRDKQAIHESMEAFLTIAFTIVVNLWLTLSQEQWKRTNSELAHKWAMADFEEGEDARPEYRRAYFFGKYRGEEEKDEKGNGGAGVMHYTRGFFDGNGDFIAHPDAPLTLVMRASAKYRRARHGQRGLPAGGMAGHLGLVRLHPKACGS